MKKILIILFLLLIGSFLVWKFQILNSKSQKKNIKEMKIGIQTLSVETAKTIPEITLGLGQRDVLGSDGMLFVMPTRITPSFWMKDMRFDLDFVWIDTDTVVDLTENVPSQKGMPDNELKIYTPRFPVTHVLEMNAGEVKRRGIKISDKVSINP